MGASMGSRIRGYTTLTDIAGDNLISSFDDYSNNRTVLRFKCIDCTTTFNTTGSLYLNSMDAKRCTHCKHKLQVNNATAKDVFINRCRGVHGQYYTYDKIPETFSATDKIIVTCPKHGDFLQTADQHSRGSGCTHCKIDKVTSATRSTKTDFIIKANNVHKFRYNYDSVEYTDAKTSVRIVCDQHGAFYQTPDVHLRGSGCSVCTNTSAPVQSILQSLNKHNIIYTTEKTFPGCVGIGNKLLRFDIYVPDRNICIEYDGVHHYAPTQYGSMSVETSVAKFGIQQANDEIKNQYCETSNINLIRIPYTVHNPDAYVTELLNNDFVAERFMYTYDMMQQDIIKVASYIKSFGYNKFAVYGIARGGVMFSVPLSYHFDGVCEHGVITFQRYDGNDKTVKFNITHSTKDIPIFVIDDLISSGITMHKAVKALQHKFKKSVIHPVVIFGEENENDVFFIKPHPKQWIVFPYEV